MNTESENGYYEVMTNDRVNIIVKEIKTTEYDFQVDEKMMNEFNEWKVDTLQNTDIPPTELEILNYFKKLKTNSCSGVISNLTEVSSIDYISKDNNINTIQILYNNYYNE